MIDQQLAKLGRSLVQIEQIAAPRAAFGSHRARQVDIFQEASDLLSQGAGGAFGHDKAVLFIHDLLGARGHIRGNHREPRRHRLHDHRWKIVHRAVVRSGAGENEHSRTLQQAPDFSLGFRSGKRDARGDPKQRRLFLQALLERAVSDDLAIELLAFEARARFDQGAKSLLWNVAANAQDQGSAARKGAWMETLDVKAVVNPEELAGLRGEFFAQIPQAEFTDG